MGTTTKFESVIAQLKIDSDGRFALIAQAAEKISKGLNSVLLKLPNEELNLINATSAIAGEGKWSLSGNPSPSSPGWPVPGFPKLRFIVPKSKVSLKVKDGGVDEQGKEKDCKFELVLSATVTSSKVDVPISLTITEKDEQTLVLGREDKKPLALNPVSLAEDSDFGSFGEELARISDLIHLRKATLVEATVQTDFKKKSITGFSIGANLTFGSVTIGLLISARTNDEGKFDRKSLTITGLLEKSDGYIQLGEILSELAGMKVWPEWLDPKLKSISLTRVFIPEAKRLNPKDTQRIVLQSPTGSKVPELLVTSSFDTEGPKIVTARLGWPALEIYSLPILGDRLRIRFDPLLAVITTKTLKLTTVATLCALDAFPGLETMGTPEKKAKDMAIARGIHCTGIFNIPEVLKVPFHFPIRKSNDDELPFEIENLEEPNAATPVPVQRSVGPLSLQGFSFKYEQGKVSLLVGVAVKIKGLTIEAIGLRVAFALKEPENGQDRVTFGIDGGLMSYAGNPLTAAGGLIRDDSSPGAADWIGAGSLKVGDNFALTALFAFRDGESKQLFLFAYVRRQLGGPPWCYITGLAVGFGYNRSFIIPPVERVNRFPLIEMANQLARGEEGAVPKVMDGAALRKIADGLKEYIPATTSGTIFGTAGMTFTSCGTVNSTVLITLTFSSRPQFVLLGSSSIDVPKNSPTAHADLQLVGAVNPETGVIALDAVLGPNSYAFARNCRLTGGFSVRTWFSGEHAKDFVISLGGYHPGYKAPDHYPVVPRLGFLWKYSDTVRLTGFAYFAITPKNFQLGGGLDLVFERGPLRAWLHVQAHFLIGWSPFTYDVILSVNVGVSFRMDLLFCSVTLSVDIGADLRLRGEPFSGYAVVHLWFVSFSFDIGAAPDNQEHKLPWSEFVSAFVTPVPPKPKPKQAALVAEPEKERFPLEIVPVGGISDAPAGLEVTSPQFKGKPITWIGDPQRFRFNIPTVIPAEVARFNDEKEFLLNSPIHAFPVQGVPRIQPELRVTFTRLDNPAAISSATRSAFQLQWTAHKGAVPAALWGQALTPAQQLASGNETVPGITHMSFVPEVFAPAESLPIDVKDLLFHVIKTEERHWESVTIPQSTFDWKSDNPFKTIKTSKAREEMLRALARLDLVPQNADAWIDVRNLREDQPAFMVNPLLCSLGAAEVVT
jgi:hypothetical protein